MKQKLVVGLAVLGLAGLFAPSAFAAGETNQTFTCDTKTYVPFDSSTTVTVTCPDAEAVQWVDKHFAEWFGKNAPKVKAGASGPGVSEGDESYAATVDETGVKIAANTLTGTR